MSSFIGMLKEQISDMDIELNADGILMWFGDPTTWYVGDNGNTIYANNKVYLPLFYDCKGKAEEIHQLALALYILYI